MAKFDFKREIPSSWDTCSVAIIALFTLFQVIQWRSFPLFLDIYYHLCVMAGFNDAGGYVTRAFWEYAPIGRPHLYPPLLHALMLLVYKLGFTKIFIARFFNSMIYPLVLASIWAAFRKLFTERLSFFALLIFASSYSLYLSVMNLIPFSLVLIFGLFLFVFLEERKLLTCSLLMGLCFYTHTFASWLILLALFLYGQLNSARRRDCIKVALIGLIFGLPILCYQFYHRQYFRFAQAMENYYLDINLAIFILATAGIILAARKKGRYYILLSIFIGFLPLVFTHKMRYISGIGLGAFAFSGALALDRLYENLTTRLGKVLLITILAILYVVTPILSINRASGKSGLNFLDSSLINILNAQQKELHPAGLSIHHPRFQDKIINVILKSSQSDDILWSDLKYSAGVLSYFSGRATSCAMMSEVKPYSQFDPLGAAKIIVLFKDTDSASEQAIGKLADKYKLNKIEETELAYIYLNPQAQAKRNIPKPVVPTALLFSILLAVLALIICDNRKKWGQN